MIVDQSIPIQLHGVLVSECTELDAELQRNINILNMQPESTFLFGRTGQRVFVLMLPRHPTVFHAAEEGSPGASSQERRPDGAIHLYLNPSCTQEDNICSYDI